MFRAPSAYSMPRLRAVKRGGGGTRARYRYVYMYIVDIDLASFAFTSVTIAWKAASVRLVVEYFKGSRRLLWL